MIYIKYIFYIYTMELTNKQLKAIRNNIKDIDVHVHWDNEYSEFDETITIESAKFYIDFEVSVRGERRMTNYGFMEEPEWRDHSYATQLYDIKVWSPEAEEVALTDKQQRSIVLSLIDNIYIR